jgi:hypothetical protein
LNAQLAFADKYFKPADSMHFKAEGLVYLATTIGEINISTMKLMAKTAANGFGNGATMVAMTTQTASRQIGARNLAALNA